MEIGDGILQRAARSQLGRLGVQTDNGNGQCVLKNSFSGWVVHIFRYKFSENYRKQELQSRRNILAAALGSENEEFKISTEQEKTLQNRREFNRYIHEESQRLASSRATPDTGGNQNTPGTELPKTNTEAITPSTFQDPATDKESTEEHTKLTSTAATQEQSHLTGTTQDPGNSQPVTDKKPTEEHTNLTSTVATQEQSHLTGTTQDPGNSQPVTDKKPTEEHTNLTSTVATQEQSHLTGTTQDPGNSQPVTEKKRVTRRDLTRGTAASNALTKNPKQNLKPPAKKGNSQPTRNKKKETPNTSRAGTPQSSKSSTTKSGPTPQDESSRIKVAKDPGSGRNRPITGKNTPDTSATKPDAGKTDAAIIGKSVGAERPKIEITKTLVAVSGKTRTISDNETWIQRRDYWATHKMQAYHVTEFFDIRTAEEPLAFAPGISSSGQNRLHAQLTATLEKRIGERLEGYRLAGYIEGTKVSANTKHCLSYLTLKNGRAPNRDTLFDLEHMEKSSTNAKWSTDFKETGILGIPDVAESCCRRVPSAKLMHCVDRVIKQLPVNRKTGIPMYNREGKNLLTLMHKKASEPVYRKKFSQDGQELTKEEFEWVVGNVKGFVHFCEGKEVESPKGKS